MKTLILSLIFLSLVTLAQAQVGIGNTNPNASLDITASNAANPANNDGLLIPRIDEFPATDPVAASDGLMVFATGNGSITKGFYYWNEAASSWTNLAGANSVDELSDGVSDSDGSNNGSSLYLGIDAGITDNLTDNRSVGIGFEALRLNTNGRDNIGIGNQALRSNVNGFSNIAIGTGTLFNSTGNGNIGIGFNALNDNTTASDNIGIGFASLENNTTGVNNVGVGSQTLSNNTLGFFNNAFGRHSLQSNIDGNGNTAMGHGSLRDNTSGSNNTAYGNSAGDNVNGVNNVFIGRGAGVGLAGSTNSGNVVIGNETGSGLNYNNRLYIDNSNTTSPLLYGEFDNNLLRVNGILDVNNQYQLPTSDGIADQVLQTDGAGNLNWVDPSTLGASEWTDGGGYVTPGDGIGEYVAIGTTTTSGSLTVEGLAAGTFPAASLSKTSSTSWSSTLDVNSNFTGGGISTHNIVSGNSSSSGVGLYQSYNDFSGVNSTGGATITGTFNFFNGSGTTDRRGFSNSFGGTHTGVKIGLVNAFNNSNSGTRYGVYTNLGAGSANKYGSYVFNSTSSTGGSNYGLRVYMGGTAGSNYGIYSFAASNINNFAGYFVGKVYMNSQLGIGVNNPSYDLQLSANLAAKPTSSAWTVPSDRRLKSNIKPFKDGLATLSKIDPIWYTYTGKAGMPRESAIGTIAQELQKVAPYMVEDWVYTSEDGKTKENYLAVDYGAIDFVLINSIKEQQEIIKTQEARIKALEDRLLSLEALIQN